MRIVQSERVEILDWCVHRFTIDRVFLYADGNGAKQAMSGRSSNGISVCQVVATCDVRLRLRVHALANSASAPLFSTGVALDCSRGSQAH